MRKPIQATLTLPKMETRRVWAGLYGGHYDMIIFFSKKPSRSKTEKIPVVGGGYASYYDGLDNQNLIVGDLPLGWFYLLFPGTREALKPYTQSDGRPKATEVLEVFPLDLTALWDEDDGKLASVNFHNDWR